MLYKIFCSKFATVEELKNQQIASFALDEKIFTQYREIEANSPIDAVHQYIDLYLNDIEELESSRIFGSEYCFFLIDDSGAIHPLS